LGWQEVALSQFTAPGSGEEARRSALQDFGPFDENQVIYPTRKISFMDSIDENQVMVSACIPTSDRHCPIETINEVGSHCSIAPSNRGCPSHR
jgi:hypothetical protein